MVIGGTNRASAKWLHTRINLLNLPKVQAVDDRCFNHDRLVKSLRKLCVVIIELAPAATQHSLTRAEQVIGHAEARSIEQSAIGNPESSTLLSFLCQSNPVPEDSGEPGTYKA